MTLPSHVTFTTLKEVIRSHPTVMGPFVLTKAFRNYGNGTFSLPIKEEHRQKGKVNIALLDKSLALS